MHYLTALFYAITGNITPSPPSSFGSEPHISRTEIVGDQIQILQLLGTAAHLTPNLGQIQVLVRPSGLFQRQGCEV